MLLLRAYGTFSAPIKTAEDNMLLLRAYGNGMG